MIALTFPGGQIQTIEIGATAGNQNTDYTPGSLVRSIILGGNLTIICDGTVVNRVLKLFILTSSSDVIEESFQSDNITAGQTRQVIFSKNSQEADSNPAQHGHLNIPDSWIIEGSEIFRIKINNGQSGDAYTGRFRVLSYPI